MSATRQRRNFHSSVTRQEPLLVLLVSIPDLALATTGSVESYATKTSTNALSRRRLLHICAFSLIHFLVIRMEAQTQESASASLATKATTAKHCQMTHAASAT